MVLLSIHYLYRSRKGEKNFDLYHITKDKKFNHVGLAENGRHWNYLPDDNIIPQIFCVPLKSQQLDTTTSYNLHDYISGPYQHESTYRLTTINIIGRRTERGRDN